MKRMGRKLAALIAAALMLAGCHQTPTATTPTVQQPAIGTTPVRDTLVVGYDAFSGVFSPFFAKTQFDQDVSALITAPLLDHDRTGNALLNGIQGDTAAYNGTEYTYTGLADCTVTPHEDGTVTYDFQLRDNVTFSDGRPLTADDVIFSMYVLSDPTYDGTATFYTLPITGMKAYREGLQNSAYATVADALWAAGRDATEYEDFTEEQFTAFWGECLLTAGEAFVGDICNYCATEETDFAERCGNNEVCLGMYAYGYGQFDDSGVFTDALGRQYDLVTTFPTKADFWECVLANHNGDLTATGVDRDTVDTSFETFLKTAFIQWAATNEPDVAADVTTISGIQKTGTHSLSVTMTEYDAAAIHKLAIPVAPLHYYGAEDQYDYDNDSFGFPKGDLSGVKAKTTAPLGAGPYCFAGYTDGTLTLDANPAYYKGRPKIAHLQLVETAAADKVSGLLDGRLDLTIPSFSKDTATALQTANGGTLTGATVTTLLSDNLGYGYLGINAARVKVGTDPQSTASKNLRKGFATLFAVYREAAIASYYGESAAVIDYPISNTSWAAPQPSDEGYTVAFSTDVNGDPLYTEAVTDQERYAIALDAAVGFFKAAGYIWDDTTEQFLAAPEGARMNYKFAIPSEGTDDHPNYAIVTAAKEALATIGITLEIDNTADYDRLRRSLDAGTCDMWTAAWTASPDPDMYQIYHSSNVFGQGGTNSNYYAITDSELDQQILQARLSNDLAFRKETYKTCLDIVLDWGVEIPAYQRQNAVVFSTARVNAATVTPDITPFWSWMDEIERWELT